MGKKENIENRRAECVLPGGLGTSKGREEVGKECRWGI
jgi:hypothetical protein